MNARFRNLNPRARRLMVVGNAALVMAIGLWSFARTAERSTHVWLDFACGLLFGISIASNLAALRLSRPCRESRI